MIVSLSLEERDRLMELLTEEQLRFVHESLVRGRRTHFARQLAEGKCQFIPEDAEPEELDGFIEEWDYIGFTDSGAISTHTKCECGRSLRYQHKVMHVPSGTIRYFGIDHLQLHTGIDAGVINAIMRGFDILDNELHEVLIKHRDGWRLEHYMYLPLPEELMLPRDIREQIDAGLPLLDRQLLRLRAKLRELERGKRLKKAMADGQAHDPPRSLRQDDGLAAAPSPHDDIAASPAYLIAGVTANSPSPLAVREHNQSDGSGTRNKKSSKNEEQLSFFFDEFDSTDTEHETEEYAASATANAHSPAGSGSDQTDDGEKSPNNSMVDLNSPGGIGIPAAPDHAIGIKSFAEQNAAGRSAGFAASSGSAPSLFRLSPECRAVIDSALPRGRVSCAAVSEFLIEQGLAPDRRMSTGKPDIFIAVAAYLDNLVAAGLCELDDATTTDRVYRRT